MAELLDDLAAEFAARACAGETPSIEEYAARHPQLAEGIYSLFPPLLRILSSLLDQSAATTRPTISEPSTTKTYEPKASLRLDGDPMGVRIPGGATIQKQPLADVGSRATVVGRYVMGEEIARGGMGAVHRATDLAFGREVALKLLREDLVGTPSATRFFTEARITGQLQHPSIPPVYDLGDLPDGRPFLAMKLIRGKTLADRLKDRASTASELNEFLAVFEQICLAVAYAHSRGVVHRDLKPANVMVGAFGEVQVMDWGLAKALERPLPQTEAEGLNGTLAYFAGVDRGAFQPEGRIPGAANDEETRAGTIMGTVAYMPPEQALGDLDRVDARSDVFSLGAILCVILTGRPPYMGATAQEVWHKASAADLEDAHRRLTTCSLAPKAVELARRCLHADPARRFAHAGEVAVAVSDARSAMTRMHEEDLSETDVNVEALLAAAAVRANGDGAPGVGRQLGGYLVGTVFVAVLFWVCVQLIRRW